MTVDVRGISATNKILPPSRWRRVLSGHVLSASTALAYPAVGAAAVVGRSVAEAVATAFDWFRSRNGKPAHRAK